MIDLPQVLAARLRSEAEKTGAFFRHLTLLEWEQQIYTEGAGWSVRQVLAHLLAAEIAFQLLIEAICSGGEGAPEDLDLNAYNEKRVRGLDEQTPEQLLEAFAQAREVTAGQVAGLQPEDLERSGRHPFLGLAPLEEMIKLIYRHNQVHQREIRRGLAGQESRGSG